MKIVLNTKSGLQKILQTRKYNRCAERVYQDAKVRSHGNLSYHISVSYCFPRSLYLTEPMTDCNFIPNRLHHQKLVGFAFALIIFANLTLSIDQIITIGPPTGMHSLYTDAGLSARMHSRHLLCKTIGWRRCGRRCVTELRSIRVLICYKKR